MCGKMFWTYIRSAHESLPEGSAVAVQDLQEATKGNCAIASVAGGMSIWCG